MDLIVFYSPEKACMTYYINNDQTGYKIEYPFSNIKNISLENGGLAVELYEPTNFFIDSSGSGGFFQCGDFTEDQQASAVMFHHLGGDPKILISQLAKLVLLHPATQPNTLGPVSATNFLSDYTTPSLFSQGVGQSALQPLSYNTPYTIPYSSAMVDLSNMAPPPPLSFMNHSDTNILPPVIRHNPFEDVYYMSYDHHSPMHPHSLV